MNEEWRKLAAAEETGRSTRALQATLAKLERLIAAGVATWDDYEAAFRVRRQLALAGVYAPVGKLDG